MAIALSRAARRRYAEVRTRTPGRPLAAAALLPLAVGYLLSYLFRNVNGVVAGDIMRDLGVGADTLGLLTSVYFLTFALAQLPVGVLLDRYGPRRVQCTLLLCASAGAGLCASSGGIETLLLGRALIGFGTAGGLVAGLKASIQWFPREQLATVNGLFIMCGGLGALAATWPAELLLRVVDWRGLSAVLAGAASLVALTICGVVPDREQAPAHSGEGLRLRDVVRDPLFRRFAPLSASCFGTVLAIQGLWVGPWLADVDGLSRPEVATNLAFMALVLIAAAPGWGLLTQRLRSRMRLTRVAAGAACVLIAAEMLVLARTERWPASSRHRFALAKWSFCRLLSCDAAGGASRRKGVARPERRPTSGGESHAAAICGR